MKLAAAGLLVVALVGTARAGESKAGDLVGTWRGRGAWKGCSVAGNARVVVELSWKDGAYRADLAGARDDLGVVSLGPGDDAATLVGTRDDLKVTMKPGARATITLATDGGCNATLTLARDGSGIAACDQLLALAAVESTCDAAGDARGTHLAGARGKLAGWKKLRGRARQAASAQCAKDADELSSALDASGCLPTAIGFGVPECDAYLAGMQRYAMCKSVSVEAKQALQQAIGQIAEGWKALRDPKVPPEARKAAADACKQAWDALRQAAAASGCTI